MSTRENVRLIARCSLSLSGIKLEIWTALTKARSDNHYAGPDLEQE